MQITRRFFLKSSGSLAAYCGLLPSLPIFDDEQSALPAAAGKTLVVVFLRGGIDGLNLIVPHGDDAYYRLRNWVVVRRPGEQNGAIDLDGFFGLNPAAASMAPLFQEGSAVALQAVGYAENTRSHFEEQDVWETGIAGNTIHSDGWLNRHLATSQGNGIVRAVAIGDTLPRILRGDAQALALRGLSDLSLGTGREKSSSVVAALERGYRSNPGDQGTARELLSRSANATLAALKELRKVAGKEYQSDVAYPDTEIGRQMREVARLIRADVGLEVCEVDFGGWDTHRDQGAAGGPYSNRVRQLADALTAFTRDLEQRLDDVMVLTLSEFGRTAAQNGTGGTDHGWGNCLLALGGPVLAAGEGKPRKVLGDWPGLSPDQLHQGRDLRHTTDFRDVLAEVVRLHLGNRDLQRVLPGHEFKRVGLI